MTTPAIQNAFAAGELSPSLYARTDLSKFHTGAALLKNFFVDPRGGASYRPGTKFVGRSKRGIDCPVTFASSQVGTIIGWINPVGMRDELAHTNCSAIQLYFISLNTNNDDLQGLLQIAFQNEGDPTKLNIFVFMQQLISANGDIVRISASAAAGFSNDPADFAAIPDDGFPLAIQWDFSTGNWALHMYQGHADGTWTQIDVAYNNHVNSTTTHVTPCVVGSPLDPNFSFCNSSANPNFGSQRGFFFDFGSEDLFLNGIINPGFPPDDPYVSDQWDPAEWCQWWCGFGQSPDVSTAAAMAPWFDVTSSPKWAPKNWGTDGAIPTGTAPPYYLRRGPEAGKVTNDGTYGGSLTLYSVTTADATAPTANAVATTIPAAGSYQGVGVRFGFNSGAITILPAVDLQGFCNECVVLPPRLIPFQFSTIQGYVLEFGNQYMRVIKDGGYVLEPAFAISNISQSNPATVTAVGSNFSNGDWVFISGVAGMTEVNDGTFIVDAAAAGSFDLLDLDGNAIDATAFTAYTSGGTAARLFTLTTPYLDVDLPLLKYAQSFDVLTLTHPLYAPRDLTRTAHYIWTLTVIVFGPVTTVPTGPVATASAGGTTLYRYRVTAVSLDTSEESRPSLSCEVLSVAMSQTAGSYITVTWNTVSDAAFYNVYRQPEVATGAVQAGQLYGFIGSTFGPNFKDQNIAPDFSRTPPVGVNPFADSKILYWTITAAGSGYVDGEPLIVTDTTGSGWTGFVVVSPGTSIPVAIITQYGGQDYTAPTIGGGSGSGLAATAILGPATGNWPSCVSYFEQRKVFAATLNLPEAFWMSQVGNYHNFDVSIPTRDSDAISDTIAGLQANPIKCLVPMSSGLIAMSSTGAWQISGGELGAPITPASASAKPQSFPGVSDVLPLVIVEDILFVQQKNNVVRDLTYNFYVNKYTGSDVSVLANHLFFGKAIKEWAYQDEPFKLVWTIRTDGLMLAFTFLKEQEIYAWTRHDTQGDWSSVAAISEGDEDAIYMVAKRVIPGVNAGAPVYYIERMASRQFKRDWLADVNPSMAWFLDCALRFEPTLPAACIVDITGSISTYAGTVTFVVDEPIFTADDIGKWLRVHGGLVEIDTFNSATSISGTVTLPLDSDADVVNGEWTLTAPVSEVSGLAHLNGATVMVLSNGSVEGPYTVTNGTVTLDNPSDIVLVGLEYIGQGQTLYIDTGNPTIQGRRKTIPGVTAFVYDNRGLKFGPNFDTLTAIKERSNEPMGSPTHLTTGEQRVNIQSTWTPYGQICWQTTGPLPSWVTGLVADLSVGDTSG